MFRFTNIDSFLWQCSAISFAQFWSLLMKTDLQQKQQQNYLSRPYPPPGGKELNKIKNKSLFRRQMYLALLC